MKLDRYIASLKTVTDKAIDQWDLERMREALNRAKLEVENRMMELRRAEFKGGK